MSIIVANGLNAGLFDILGGIEIRLANGKAHDLASLRFESLHFRKHFKGCLGTQQAHAVGTGWHSQFPPPADHALALKESNSTSVRKDLPVTGLN